MARTRRFLAGLLLGLVATVPAGEAAGELTLLRNGDGQRQGFFDVAVGDATHVYAVGTHDTGQGSAEPILLRSSDAGLSWTQAHPGTGGGMFPEVYLSVEAPSSQDVLVGGAGKLFVSHNGGTGWSEYTESGWSLFAGPSIVALAVPDAATGVFVASGMGRRTTDGGATWLATGAVPALAFVGVQAQGGSLLWAWAGETVTDDESGEVTGYQGGALLRSSDGGANWTASFQGEPSAVRGVHMVDAEAGWLVAQSLAGPRLARTSDGGATFVDAPLPAGAGGAPDQAWQVRFFDRCEGVLLAEREESPMVFHTADGGSTWRELDTSGLIVETPFPFQMKPRLISMDFLRRDLGFLGGTFESIVRYTPDVAARACDDGPGPIDGDGDGDASDGGCGCRVGGAYSGGRTSASSAASVFLASFWFFFFTAVARVLRPSRTRPTRSASDGTLSAKAASRSS